jgi:hypothetical protein
MRRAAIVAVAWGAWLAIWTGLLFVFVHAAFPTRQIEYDMLGSAAFAAVLAGFVVWRLDARARDHDSPRLLSDDSLAAVTLAIGLAMALVGASFGLWLILIGAGVAALGLGGLVREQLGRRRAARRGGRR